MLHELGVPTQLMQVNFDICQVFHIELGLQVVAHYDWSHGKDDLYEVLEDGASDLTAADHISVLNLDKDGQQGVATANDADD